jgi:hypothetical protein
MKQLAAQLKANKSKLAASQNQVTLGFDGFVDSIMRFIKENRDNKSPLHFRQMEEFSNYVRERAGKNFSLEMQTVMIKPGGNMPIMANALGRVGVKVNCIGALGYPAIDPVFKNLDKHCELYSFAPPGLTQAIEFKDGKMILCQMDELNAVDWSIVKSRLGLPVLTELINTSTLFCMLNWGELTNSTGIWNGILTEVLPFCNNNNKRTFFVDPADCTKRTADEVKQLLLLLKEFNKYGKITLGLNHNEASFIYQILFGANPKQDTIDFTGTALFKNLCIDTLLVHNRNEAIAFRTGEQVSEKSFLVTEPKLLTGAGDNFNAGFCLAQLMQMNLQDCLLLAHFAAAHYIKNGVSANWDTLIEELEKVS